MSRSMLRCVLLHLIAFAAVAASHEARELAATHSGTVRHEGEGELEVVMIHVPCNEPSKERPDGCRVPLYGDPEPEVVKPFYAVYLDPENFKRIEPPPEHAEKFNRICATAWTVVTAIVSCFVFLAIAVRGSE